MAQQKRKFGFETRMLHAGYIPDPVTGARAVPIYQTTSYVFDDVDTAAQLFELKEYGHIYTRIGNPTTAVLEERIASLENATGAVATASGMAAQFVALMTLLSPGDEVVASAHLYGGTVTQLTHTFRKLSVAVRFVDPANLDAWEQAITPRTRALYGETIGKPRGSSRDLAAVPPASPGCPTQFSRITRTMPWPGSISAAVRAPCSPSGSRPAPATRGRRAGASSSRSSSSPISPTWVTRGAW